MSGSSRRPSPLERSRRSILTSRRPSCYVRSGSHFIRRDELGTTMVDTRANPAFVLPKVLFAASTPRHTIENTGEDDLVVIGVELKNLRGD